MAVSKKKKTESISLEERVSNLEKLAHTPVDYIDRFVKVESRLNILYSALKETRESLNETNLIVSKIKDRMGL